MKFKIKHEKVNLVFMTSVLILCLITCVIWLMIREYSYFIIYLILTFLIGFIYYNTSYFLTSDCLVIKLGFVKIKIRYRNIKKSENLQNSIKLTHKNFSMNIYPSNKDIFYAELNNKMKGN